MSTRAITLCQWWWIEKGGNTGIWELTLKPTGWPNCPQLFSKLYSIVLNKYCSYPFIG